MTENNAAQPGLTDEEILDAIKAGVRAARDEGLACAGPDNYVVAGALALLSKLRAEGVQAGDEVEWAGYRPLLRDAIAAKDAMHEAGIQYAKFGVMFPEMMRRYAAALASAPVDPEAAEVEFLVQVLEKLETWRAEEWNELIERRPAILALLRPLVVASAPVAGEAVTDDMRDAVRFAPSSAYWSRRLVEFFGPHAREGINALEKQLRVALADASAAGEATIYLDAGHLREVLAGNDMPVSASAEPGHGMVPLHAAPQASEAVRPNIPPAKPLPDLMMASYHEAIGWNACRAAMLQSAPQADKDGGDCAKGAGDQRAEFEAWAVGILGDNPTWRESAPCELAWQAWTESRAALSAQPAAQKQGDSDE